MGEQPRTRIPEKAYWEKLNSQASKVQSKYKVCNSIDI